MEAFTYLQHAGADPRPHGHGSPQNRLWLVDKLVRHLTGGGSLLLTGADGTANVLAAAADVLARGRTRVLRVRPPLDLPGFMQQVGRAGPATEDAEVERGFDALTALTPDCDRIALLVEDAHLLPYTTLFYLQFVLRGEPPLQLALAGNTEIADTLALEGFAGLRARLALQLTISAPPKGVPDSSGQAGRLSRVRQVLARVFAGPGPYASLSDRFPRLRR